MENSRRIDFGLLLAALLALFAIHPLLRPGLPATADTPVHFYRTLEFARSWGPGVIYPRWAPDLAYGYGYPLWNFAPPLPYLIPLALRAVGLSLEAGTKGLVIMTALGYALGAYLLVRDWWGAKAGLVAAAIYTLAPFTLRELLLYGGNYPQYLAIGLFPWVLWGLGRVHRGGKWFDILLTALLYGAVVLSHLFHTLTLTAVVAVYAGALWLSSKRDVRRLGALALSLATGLLWTTFFWLPAFVERKFTHALANVYLKINPFYQHFLTGSELFAWPRALDRRAANPWAPLSLGVAAVLLAILGLLAAIVMLRTKGAGPSKPTSANRPLPLLFFLLLPGASIFMMLPISHWVWQNVPLLAIAEFPWRLLGLANLGLAFWGGASVYLFTLIRQRQGRFFQVIMSLGGTLIVLFASAVYLYPPRPFLRYSEAAPDITRYELSTGAFGLTTLKEFLPQWVETAPTTSPMVDSLMQNQPIDKLDQTTLPESATAELLQHTAVSDSYRFDSPQPFRARFLTFYFPGWRAYLDGQPVEIIIEAQSGLITVPLPSGSHQLSLRFGDTPLRIASNIVTGLTLLAMVAISLWQVVGKRAKRVATHQRPSAPGWTWPSALFVGAVLAGLLLIKTLLVDPHTTWFRRESPPGQVLGVQHPMRVNLGDKFWLLGYDLNRDTVAQGGNLQVVLYWRAQQPLSTDYRSFVHLDAPTDQQTWAGSDNSQPGDFTAQIEIPTSTWDTEHYVRDEHVIAVPPSVPPVRFNLRAGFYDPRTGRRLSLVDGEGDSITLQSIQVVPGQRLRRDAVPNQRDYRLGEHIHLLGYDWDHNGAALTLFWQTDQPLTDDYTVFVHVLDEEGNLVRSADSPPLGGLYPTSAWQPNTIIADPRSLRIADLSLVEYTLAVGMYHPHTLARLPVTSATGERVVEDAIPLMRLSLP